MNLRMESSRGVSPARISAAAMSVCHKGSPAGMRKRVIASGTYTSTIPGPPSTVNRSEATMLRRIVAMVSQLPLCPGLLMGAVEAVEAVAGGGDRGGGGGGK